MLVLGRQWFYLWLTYQEGQIVAIGGPGTDVSYDFHVPPLWGRPLFPLAVLLILAFFAVLPFLIAKRTTRFVGRLSSPIIASGLAHIVFYDMAFWPSGLAGWPIRFCQPEPASSMARDWDFANLSLSILIWFVAFLIVNELIRILRNSEQLNAEATSESAPSAASEASDA